MPSVGLRPRGFVEPAGHPAAAGLPRLTSLSDFDNPITLGPSPNGECRSGGELFRCTFLPLWAPPHRNGGTGSGGR